MWLKPCASLSSYTMLKRVKILTTVLDIRPRIERKKFFEHLVLYNLKLRIFYKSHRIKRCVPFPKTLLLRTNRMSEWRADRGQSVGPISEIAGFKNTIKSEILISNAPVKLFWPHPSGQPRGHHFFWGCPGLPITLCFPCPALYKNSNHSFFQCPDLIYHTHFSSDPGAARRGWGIEQFDRRITITECMLLITHGLDKYLSAESVNI